MSLLRLLLFCWLLGAPLLGQEVLDQPEDSDPLDRVVVLGASMSSGFGLQSELNANFDLARTLALAIPDEGTRVESLASTFFFQNPLLAGARSVEQALGLDPTLVVALDFLFWYSYGHGMNCSERLDRLNRGLELLETIRCPILLGDLPNMGQITRKDEQGRNRSHVLRRSQVPSDACLVQLNLRLNEWAAERQNIHVYSLATFSDLQRGEALVEVRGNRYDKQRMESLMQADRLHPTYRGTVIIAITALDRLADVGLVDEKLVTWDANRVESLVWEATSEERSLGFIKRVERDARRKARTKLDRRAAQPGTTEPR
jgi:hypothetical protein